VLKRFVLTSLIFVTLIAALLLHGCTVFDQPEAFKTEPPATPEETIDPATPFYPTDPPVLAEGKFTLRYDSKSSMNPITSLNRDNILLSALLYESLFVLDGNLNLELLLCESWSTEDDFTFEIVIKPNIAMSDGSRLTADDVAYTIRQAAQKGRFVNRFKNIATVTSDGEFTVTVVLDLANSRFMRLLDIPIIKNGSIDNRLPPGTGPYIFSDEEDVLQLYRFPRHRDYLNLPLAAIYLIECGDDELTQLFDDGKISLLLDDPSDAFEITLNRLPEKRYFDTTAIQFIGFNARTGVMRNPDVRRAVGASIDRDYIVSEIMSGQAIAAPLHISPAFEQYNKDWERRYLDPMTEMTLLLQRANMDDYNEDSFLEIKEGYDSYSEFTVDFIVNSENIMRVRAASFIAETLRQYGIRINLRELPWETFLSELKNANFDMYYGEIMLSPDYDLSPLVLPGALNYGGVASTTFKQNIDAFLAASSDDDIQNAAYQLMDELTPYAPFIPILYKKHVVYSPMGAISGAHPGQTNIFRNFTDWNINLTMLK